MSDKVPIHSLNAVNGCIVDLSSSLIKKAPAKGAVFSDRDATSASFAADPACVRLPEIAIYEHINWGGAKDQTTLNWVYVGGFWNDKISSIVILGGVWRLYEHRDFVGQSWDYGPGQYASIPNDIVSSFKLIRFC